MGMPCLCTALALIYKAIRCDISEDINLYSHPQGNIKYNTELFMATNRATMTEKVNMNLSLKSVVII